MKPARTDRRGRGRARLGRLDRAASGALCAGATRPRRGLRARPPRVGERALLQRSTVARRFRSAARRSRAARAALRSGRSARRSPPRAAASGSSHVAVRGLALRALDRRSRPAGPADRCARGSRACRRHRRSSTPRRGTTAVRGLVHVTVRTRASRIATASACSPASAKPRRLRCRRARSVRAPPVRSRARARAVDARLAVSTAACASCSSATTSESYDESTPSCSCDAVDPCLERGDPCVN